jgi:hypothetical protein
LFKRAVCDPGDVACGKVQSGGLPAAPPELLASSASAAAIAAAIREGWGLRRAELGSLRARDDPPLLSRTTCPEAPPPRHRPA